MAPHPRWGRSRGAVTWRSTDELYRERWTRVIEAWQQRPGASIGTKAKQSVALYLRAPAASDGRRAVLALYVGGDVTVYRGYLADSGMCGDQPDGLDDLIRELFPSAQWERSATT